MKPIAFGAITTVAGFQSRFISHTVDIKENRQTSHSIGTGDYRFVGGNSVLLGVAALPNYCVLGAQSLPNKSYTQTHRLCDGISARELNVLSPPATISTAAQGFVI